MTNRQVTLHLTDVYFSKEEAHEGDTRTLALEQLAQTVAEQPDDWQPSIICLTGDLAMRGKPDDYQLLGA